MNWNYLNPQYALARLLERCGLDYQQRTEFAAHVLAGTVAALLGMWPVIVWSAYSIFDELAIDRWKGSDTIWDLCSKLAGPIVYAVCALRHLYG
jgi:hypothetical protein